MVANMTMWMMTARDMNVFVLRLKPVAASTTNGSHSTARSIDDA